MKLEDLDFDSSFDVEPTTNQFNTSDNEDYDDDQTVNNDDGSTTSEEEKDVLSTLLHRQGIIDPNKIKFEGEDGNIEERSWDDLSYDEQLNILTGEDQTPNESEENDLDDDEINLINSIREGNITPQQYLQQVKQQAIQEYLSQNGQVQKTYAVDDYTDDELFVYDMQARMPELTEEEITQALESAKMNESVFQKQVNGLRAEYKKLEENKIQQEQVLAQQQQQEEFNNYANAIWDNIGTQQDIAGTFELEDDDKQLLAQFILGQDQAGISYLGKALNDPDTLIKMSWFALKGEEAIDSLNEYYKEQITKARESGYAKGLEDAKKGTTKSQGKVVSKPNKQKLIRREVKSIDDLEFD